MLLVGVGAMAAAADAACGVGGGVPWQQQQLLLPGAKEPVEEEEQEEDEEEEEEALERSAPGGESSLRLLSEGADARACETGAAAAAGRPSLHSAYPSSDTLFSRVGTRLRGSSSSRDGGARNGSSRHSVPVGSSSADSSSGFYESLEDLDAQFAAAASGSRRRYVPAPPSPPHRRRGVQQQQQLPQLLYLPIKDTDTHVVLPAAPPTDFATPPSVSPVLLLDAAAQQGSSSNSSGGAARPLHAPGGGEGAAECKGGGGAAATDAGASGGLSVYARSLLEGRELPEAADFSTGTLQPRPSQQQGHTVFAVAADCRLIGEMLKREVCLLRHWLACALHFHANNHVGSFLSILQDADYCANTVLYSNADVSNQPLAELPPAATPAAALSAAAAATGRGFVAKDGRTGAVGAAADAATHAAHGAAAIAVGTGEEDDEAVADERLRTEADAAAAAAVEGAAGCEWEGDWRVVVDAALAAHHTHAALRAWDAATRRDELQRSEEWREKADAAAGFAEACRAAAGASHGVPGGAAGGAAPGDHVCAAGASGAAAAACAGAAGGGGAAGGAAAGTGMLALNISLLRRKDPSLLSLCTSAFLRLAKALLLLSGNSAAPLPTRCLPSSALMLGPAAAAIVPEPGRGPAGGGGAGVPTAAGGAGATAAADLSMLQQQQLLQQQSSREMRAAEELFRIAAVHAPLQVAPLLGLASCAVYERRWADALLLYCRLIAYCPTPPAALTAQQQQQLLRLLGVAAGGRSPAAAATALQQQQQRHGTGALSGVAAGARVEATAHRNGLLSTSGSSGIYDSSSGSSRFAADLRYAAGMCFYRLGRLAEARRAFARALCLFPQHAGALCGAACLLQPQEAQQQLLLLLLANRYEPSDAVVLLQLAGRAILHGELQQAEQLLRAAQPPSYCLELQGEQKYLLGWLLQQQNKPQEAVVELQRAHVLRPHHCATTFRYAQCLLLLGGQARIREAQRLLQQLLGLSQNFDALRLMGCAVLLEAELCGNTTPHGKTAAGEYACGAPAAAARAGGDGTAAERGNSLLQMLQLYEKALEYLLSAAAVDPSDAITLLLLARCYETLITSAQEARYRRPCIVVYEKLITLCVRQQQERALQEQEREEAAEGEGQQKKRRQREQQQQQEQLQEQQQKRQQPHGEKGRAGETAQQPRQEKDSTEATTEARRHPEDVWAEGDGGGGLQAVATGAAEMPEAVPVELLNNLAVLYYAQRNFNLARFLLSHVLERVNRQLACSSGSGRRGSTGAVHGSRSENSSTRSASSSSRSGSSGRRSSSSGSGSGSSNNGKSREGQLANGTSCGPQLLNGTAGVNDAAAAAGAVGLGSDPTPAAAAGTGGPGGSAPVENAADLASLVALRQLVIFNLCLVLVSVGSYGVASSYLRELCSSHSSSSSAHSSSSGRSGSRSSSHSSSSSFRRVLENSTWVVPLPEAWLLRAHLATERGDALAAKRLCEGAMAAGFSLAGGVLARTTAAAAAIYTAAGRGDETPGLFLSSACGAGGAAGSGRSRAQQQQQLAASSSSSGRSRSSSRDAKSREAAAGSGAGAGGGGGAALGKAVSLGWAPDAALTLGKLLADCGKIEAAINAVLRVAGVKSAAGERDAFAFTFLATLQHRKARRLLQQQQSTEKAYAALAEARYFFALALQASPANSYAANGIALLLAEENLTKPALSIFRVLVESPLTPPRGEVFYAVQANSGLLLAALALTERPDIKLAEDLRKVDLQKLHRAFRHLLIALEVAPMKKHLYLLLARLLYDCAKFDAAVVVLQAALQRWPNDLCLAYNLVVCMDARVCGDIRMREKMEDPQLMQHLLFICQSVVQLLQRLIDAKQTWGHIDAHALQQVRLGLLPANALHAGGGGGVHGGSRGGGMARGYWEDDSSNSSGSRDAYVRMAPEGVEALPSLQQLENLLIKSKEKILPHLRKSLPLIEQNWKEQQERREARRRYQEERRRSLQEKKRQQQQQEEAEQQRQSERAQQLLEEARAIVATLPLKREEEGTAAGGGAGGGGGGRGGSAAAAERRAAAAAADEEERDSGDEQQLPLGVNNTAEHQGREERDRGSHSRGRKRRKEPQERKLKQQQGSGSGSSKEKSRKRLRVQQQQQRRAAEEEEEEDEGGEGEEEDDTAGERKYGEPDVSNSGATGWLPLDAAAEADQSAQTGREEDAGVQTLASSGGEGRRRRRRRKKQRSGSRDAAEDEEDEQHQEGAERGGEAEDGGRAERHVDDDESAAREERRRQKKLKKKMKKMKKREKREREQQAAREEDEDAEEGEALGEAVGEAEKSGSPAAEYLIEEAQGEEEGEKDTLEDQMRHEAQPSRRLREQQQVEQPHQQEEQQQQQGEEDAQQSQEEEPHVGEHQRNGAAAEGQASDSEDRASAAVAAGGYADVHARDASAAFGDEEEDGQAPAAAVAGDEGDAAAAEEAEEEGGDTWSPTEERQDQDEATAATEEKKAGVAGAARDDGEVAQEGDDGLPGEEPEAEAAAGAAASATAELRAIEAGGVGSREGSDLLFGSEGEGAEEDEETQRRQHRRRKHKRERHEGDDGEKKKKKKKKKSSKRDRRSDIEED